MCACLCVGRFDWWSHFEWFVQLQREGQCVKLINMSWHALQYKLHVYQANKCDLVWLQVGVSPYPKQNISEWTVYIIHT